MLDTNPAVALGPRYTIRYVWPGPEGASVIYQDVYPYAKPHPVTYTKAGQPLWGAVSPDGAASPNGQHTYGGWYASTPELKLTLEEIGLSATPPSSGTDGFWSSTGQLIGIFGGIAAAASAAFGLVLGARRRKVQPYGLREPLGRFAPPRATEDADLKGY